MTSRKKRWALVGAGIGLVASVSARRNLFRIADEHDRHGRLRPRTGSRCAGDGCRRCEP